MSPPTTDVRSNFRGALLGLTVGDALAFPFRGRSRAFLWARGEIVADGFVKHDSGFYPIGQYSDDSQTALAVAAGIVDARVVDAGVISRHLLPLWRDQLVVDRTAASTEVMESLLHQDGRVECAALPVGRMEADPLPRAVPVGLWCVDSPGEIPEMAARCCTVTHRDPRLQATVAAVAAAIAHNVKAEEVVLGCFLDCLSDAAGRFHGETVQQIQDYPRILSMTEFRAFEQFSLFVSSQTGKPGESFKAGIPDNALFQFLQAIYYFLKSPFDFEASLTSALRAGGEVTTLCALVGALSGALLGEDGIPADLLAEVHERKGTLRLADALLRARESR